MLGLMEPPDDLLTVICGWLLLAWFGASLGLALGSASAYSELVNRFWHPVSYLLFPLSGAAFMVDYLPQAAQKAVLILPMVHGVELLRDGYFGDKVRTHYDIAYMAVICLVLNFIGLILARDAGRRVEPP
jgi:ABC-type polysaccharide/polyol phosphate export permease